ncbi:MAG TPA: Tol-Pal system beta propeller repeat protein TolB [Myxococcota bacterium]|nr:Tol-Pal system beta propeller repeat protein TolB [Myxococcota bacterium]
MSRVTLVGLLLCAVSGPVFAQEENPAVVVPPPTEGGVYKAAVQRFFDLGGGTTQLDSVREGIGGALEFSSLFKVLAPGAYLASDSSQRLDGTPPLACADWRQIGADALVEGELSQSGKEASVEFRVWDVPRCRKLMRKRYTGPATDLPRIAKRIGDEIVGAFTGTPGVASTEIAFISNRTGASEVFLMDADGSNVRQATHNKSINNFPSWSPDGNTIIYTSYREAHRPALYVLTRGTQSPGRVFRNLVPGAQQFRGVFDPSGGKIAAVISVDGNSDIWLVNRDGTGGRRLTNERSLEVSPAFSPNGRRMAFVSDRVGSPQIYIMDLDDGSVRRLTYTGGYNTAPAWSPDGKWIAYESRVGGGFDLWLIDPDGTTSLPLVENPRNDVSATWSPDSRKIAFSSDRRGRPSIFVVDAPTGANLRQLTREGTNTSPAWGPYLRELR